MRGTLIAGCIVVACMVILLADYVVASRRAPGDAQLILSLQQQVRADASLAPKLASEQKRITAARRARKSRDNAVAWGLIAAAALFLTCAQRVVPAYTPIRRQETNPHTAREARATRASSTPELDLSFVDEIVRVARKAVEQSKVEESKSVVAQVPPSDPAAFQDGQIQEAAILILQAIQSHYRYLPDEALLRVCELTGITPAQIAGTASFYGQFRRSPVGKHIVRVCHGTACHVAGARQITDELRRYLAIPDGADTDAERMFTVDEVACLGCCSLAPVLMVDGHTAGRLTPPSACDELERFEKSHCV
jgi:NADH:ubiquinone oxidoreductase subunit E